MKLKNDVIQLGTVPNGLLTPLQNIIKKINWADPVYNRTAGFELQSSVIRIPYSAKPGLVQTVTPDILKVRAAFESVQTWLNETFKNYVFIKGEIDWVTPDLSPDKDIDARWLKNPMHRNPAWFHEYSHRIYIPLLNNDQTLWVTEDTKTHFRNGKFYEVDDRKFHTFINNGDTSMSSILLNVMDKTIYDDAVAANVNFNQITLQNIVSYRSVNECRAKAKFLSDYNSK
jgi:hypothetical protein